MPSFAPDPRRHLSAAEADSLVEQVATVSDAGLPLADGLRAAAREASSRRLAGELEHLALLLDSGRTLDDVLQSRRDRYPPYVAGLMQAALRSGRLGSVLVDLVDWQRRQADLRRSLRAALIYPAVLLAVTCVLGLFMQAVIVRPLIELLTEFEIQLPFFTRAMIWVNHHGLRWLVLLAAVICSGLLLLRLIGGPAVWRRAVGSVPVVGALWRWSGVAEFARLVSLLFDQRLPAPEVFRLASGGLSDANMSRACRQLAEELEKGKSLADAVEANPRLPPSIGPLVRWGERSNRLSEAFGLVSELYDQRVVARCELVKGLLPPLCFVLIAVLTLSVVVGFYTPLWSMLMGLSFAGGGGAVFYNLDVNPLNLLAFAILGAALLWAAKLAFGERQRASEHWMKRLFLQAGWILLVGGTLGAILGMNLWLGIVPIVGLLVMYGGYFHFMAAERRALLWSLAVAAERGIPLEQAARAFADERSVQVGSRTMTLASLLEAGAPLPSALSLSKQPLHADTLLATRLGTETGDLAGAMRMAIDHDHQRTSLFSSLEVRLGYVAGMLAAAVLVQVFITVKIMPVFSMIFGQFGIALPQFTHATIAVSETLVDLWPIFLAVLLGVGLYVCLFFFFDRLRPGLLSWLRPGRYRDGALILRALALTVGQRRNLAATIQMLAVQHPKRTAADQLARASQHICDGRPWCDALRRVHLVGRGEAAVLQAAERVGNLEWALDEMADCQLRRSALRLRMFLNCFSPLVVLLFGAVVVVFAVGMFLPLVAMIEKLV